ncbi:snare-domain-containing protein [Myriangium duriaei CBS 260.36]|uniref:Snare-domain-containing protein n=1 Tax=Myriangium duriaei CBS 260.36 TaxID=1168546 RepID=A0A9P4MJK3_9PEZI|nr:snare-domain-containing protein [Myriangium duriaei CBS 260.36]
MAATNPHQLLLLADHIKLSLLERQRAHSLNLPADKQDVSIQRSLASLKDGISSLERQNITDLADQISRLTTQADELSTEFTSTSAPADSTTHPNDPSLAPDFAAAAAQHSSPRSSLRNPKAPGNKAVRFRDSAADEEPAYTDDPSRAGLFNDRPYSDDPEPVDHSDMDNRQIHAYHTRALAEQDEQLDNLGRSIGRQRELSIAMGNELDDQAVLLEDVDRGVDRHASTLERARGRLGKVARKAKDNWSWVTIAILVMVLVVLIVGTK